MNSRKLQILIVILTLCIIEAKGSNENVLKSSNSLNVTGLTSTKNFSKADNVQIDHSYKIPLPGFWVIVTILLAIFLPFKDDILKYVRRVTWKTTKKRLDEYTVKQIDKLKTNTKYIPEVFMEINDLKEKGRYFTDPLLFWEKAIENITKVDPIALNICLKKINMPVIKVKLPMGIKKRIGLFNLEKQSNNLITFLKEKIKEIENYKYKELKEKIDKDMEYIYQSIKHKFDYMPLYTHSGRRVLKLIELLNKKVLFITSKAGQGKTNFVCDFTEKVLLQKDQPCLFIPAKEFNYSTKDMNEIILNQVFGVECDISFKRFLKLYATH